MARQFGMGRPQGDPSRIVLNFPVFGSEFLCFVPLLEPVDNFLGERGV